MPGQIGRLLAAAKKPSIGAKPSVQQVKAGIATSLGKNKPANVTSNVASGSVRTKPPVALRGSLEGYVNPARADIQLNGTGYSNPKHQKARVSKSHQNLLPKQSTTSPFLNRGQISNVFDNTFTGSTGNSIQKLKKQMRINKF